jgi:hypothetical protein
MQRLIISGLSLLLMSATATSVVRSQGAAFNPAIGRQAPSYLNQLTPVNLVTQAYRGEFKDQGIPGYMGFVGAYKNGQIRAVDLVKLAIAENRLPQETLTDQGYLNAVEAQLRDFQNLGS